MDATTKETTMTHEQNTARTVRILMEAATLAYLSGDDARGAELETQASELLGE
jgi:hypothetical protein